MTIFCVAGLGRCGSSMTMQMLHAGGMPCVGSFPDFEDDNVSPIQGFIEADWFMAQRGKALKWLSPHEVAAPAYVPKAVIWLSRDAKQQAKSQIKFLNSVMRSVPSNRETVMKFAASIRRDERRCLESFYGKPLAVLGFEDLLCNPTSAAHRLAHFVAQHGGPDLNIEEMAAAVIARSGQCRRDMSIEVRLATQPTLSASAPSASNTEDPQ
jgi:hypothetical protein